MVRVEGIEMGYPRPTRCPDELTSMFCILVSISLKPRRAGLDGTVLFTYSSSLCCRHCICISLSTTYRRKIRKVVGF